MYFFLINHSKAEKMLSHVFYACEETIELRGSKQYYLASFAYITRRDITDIFRIAGRGILQIVEEEPPFKDYLGVQKFS